MITKAKKLFLTGFQHLRTKTVADEYLNWLTFANAGMLNKGNIYAMRHAIERLPSESPVLEIGSFCGLSTNAISYLLATQGKRNKIITCDKWLFEGAESGKNVGASALPHKHYRDFIKASFMRNVEFFSPDNKPFTLEMTSDEFFENWGKGEMHHDVFGREVQSGGRISFCYIDGNHTYAFAKRDFENTDKYLEPGGFVLFDDSSDSDPFGLTKLMKEIRQNPRYEFVMKNPNYLFKKLA